MAFFDERQTKPIDDKTIDGIVKGAAPRGATWTLSSDRTLRINVGDQQKFWTHLSNYEQPQDGPLGVARLHRDISSRFQPRF